MARSTTIEWDPPNEDDVSSQLLRGGNTFRQGLLERVLAPHTRTFALVSEAEDHAIIKHLRAGRLAEANFQIAVTCAYLSHRLQESGGNLIFEWMLRSPRDAAFRRYTGAKLSAGDLAYLPVLDKSPRGIERVLRESMETWTSVGAITMARVPRFGDVSDEAIAEWVSEARLATFGAWDGLGVAMCELQ